MALADYHLCDRCQGKAFFSASLDYDNEGRPAGAGDMKVLCGDCAKTHFVAIRPRFERPGAVNPNKPAKSPAMHR